MYLDTFARDVLYTVVHHDWVYLCSQVVYRDPVARDVFVLYIVALHSGQRKEWMDLIRNGQLVFFFQWYQIPSIEWTSMMHILTRLYKKSDLRICDQLCGSESETYCYIILKWSPSLLWGNLCILVFSSSDVMKTFWLNIQYCFMYASKWQCVPGMMFNYCTEAETMFDWTGLLGVICKTLWEHWEFYTAYNCSLCVVASEQCNAQFDTKYHSGTYNVRQRAYTCCGSIDRYCTGCCQTTFCPKNESRSRLPASQNIHSLLTPARKPVQLRSPSSDLLFAPKVNTSTCIATRAFAVDATTLWNVPPSIVKSVENIAKFHCHLMTYLYNLAYPP